MALKLMRLQATIMTDPGTADRTYVGPMTPDMVEEIIKLVRHLEHYPHMPCWVSRRLGQNLLPSHGERLCCHGRTQDFLEAT